MPELLNEARKRASDGGPLDTVFKNIINGIWGDSETISGLFLTKPEGFL
ncbi:hypothetical protein C8J48_2000 [Desmospora activa DSM 45169]|uniref:Uncharacterized protein n=1 Tax=Desmospora activa DSM 45169 TaxID=1121389 RepID=A0A2T4ZBV8_9BACL|nr:hypothetical protein C8J48_2000 [Desmospora activa DSM 45169]